MSGNLSLRFDAFGGTTVEEAAAELCAAASRVGVLCELQFNDVKLWARPGDDPARLAAAYYAEIKSARKFKIAQAR